MCAAPLLPLEDALRILAAAFPPPATPEIRADRDDPALDLSSMDGAALRSQDGAAPRRVLGTLFAGDDPAAFRVEPGTCVRIMTGAALPPGADAVVPVEDLVQGPQGLTPAAPPLPGAHVRPRGSQARKGDLLLPPGAPAGAGHTGLLAQVGLPTPPLARLRVGIVPTGDEITAHPAPHQIRDSNGPMLEALAHALGAEVRRLPPLPDRPEAVRDFLLGLGDLQILLTSGGVSAGDKDHLPRVLEAMGARILFHRIRLKPGKPMLTALLDGRVILGLPGNPVSSYMNALLFLPVAMAGLQGRRAPDPWKEGRLAAAVPNPGDRPLLHPCRREGRDLHPLPSQGSADLVRLAQADAFAWVPEGGMGAGPTRYLDTL
ncbi:molybdopterin molybdotransferase MoeA [Mesoterricola silvestris]|uniref:Molybdopterin molybdenumtransferase n=1 Tax=Mesoterricola silvestris TaxID=2927979 RepID=A0AA48K8H8_9BACT|nr:molybdopterin molybdotransferase MoeA [Mesoterricola silvestris]BDU72140.1 molybdopterin molybdenumtransferase MoeA [Mesoterricola silvestris]